MIMMRLVVMVVMVMVVVEVVVAGSMLFLAIVVYVLRSFAGDVFKSVLNNKLFLGVSSFVFLACFFHVRLLL